MAVRALPVGMRIELSKEAAYGVGLGRAAAGALIFGFPLLMTMEMWEFGFHMDRLKLDVTTMVPIHLAADAKPVLWADLMKSLGR